MTTIFKTSVTGTDDVSRLRPVLNGLVWPSGTWSFDLDDCDHILRIQGEIASSVVISILHDEGFECAELEV